MQDRETTMRNRLKQVLDHTGLTQAAFARSLDICQPHLSSVLSDKHKRRLSRRVLRAISEKYGISHDWLLTGEGTMLDKLSPITDPPELQKVITEARDVWRGLESGQRYELAATLLKAVRSLRSPQTVHQ